MGEHLDPLLARFGEFLGERLGLHFSARQYGTLRAALRPVARELGYGDVEPCIRALLGSAPSRRELETLATHLTVGETYFFRDGEALGALERRLLPELSSARSDRVRRLRLWSAGCSTGEEAYSMVIAVARSVPQWRDWNVSVLATDVNPVSLRRAQDGVYGPWSFRGVPPALKNMFFQRLADGRWRVVEHIRSAVRFSYLNLAEDGYPCLDNGSSAMDVIFCRNVLMYFAPERARAVLERLGRCLAPGGRLFVSPVEISRLAVPGLQVFKLDGAFGYMKADDTPAAPPPSRMKRDTAPAAPHRERRRAPREPAAAPAHDAQSMAGMARACANEGRLAEALAWCDKALEADKLSARWHYLRATILQELGALHDCAAALTRALYLDPHCALAHFTLGHVRRKQGRHDESLRHFRNALSALAAHADDEILAESEGLAAGRLAEAVALALSEATAA